MRAQDDKRITVVVVADGGIELVVGQLDASHPDLRLVDALARLALDARRRGWRIALRGVPPQLGGLLELVGLAELLAAGSGGGVELRREAELGEQLGVDEVVQPGDPAV
jgi:hypothetical protein